MCTGRGIMRVHDAASGCISHAKIVGLNSDILGGS